MALARLDFLSFEVHTDFARIFGLRLTDWVLLVIGHSSGSKLTRARSQFDALQVRE